MNMEKANKAIKGAWIAAIISAGLTLIFAVTGLYGLDLSALLIVIVMLGLAFGIYKKNRACAVILFVFWISDTIWGFWEFAAQGQVSGLIWSLVPRIIFAIFFFRGIRGTFAYHRIIKAETNGGKIESESVKKKSKKKPFLIGCGVAAGIVVAIAVGFIIWASSIPSGGVKMANEMHPYALEYIEEHNLLNDTEALIAYYDVTLRMNSSEAAILTTERVMYHKDGRTVSIDLKDIDDVSIDYVGRGHIIEVRSKSEMRIEIYIAHANLGELFYDALMDAWNLQKTR